MKVSVVMPAYDAERFVAEAVRSVLAQTHRDFELICIDDGSTDRTLEILGEFAARDSRVRVLRQPHGRQARALNRGLAEASSELVVVMHADDVMLPGRIAAQVEFMSANPDLAVASCLVAHIDETGRRIGSSPVALTTRDEVRAMAAAHLPIGISHPGAILRKSAVVDAGGYRDAFVPSEDVDLWNRLLERGWMVLVQPELLLEYRIHARAASVRGAREVTRKVAWITACIAARRSGKPEPSWEQFVASRRARPLGRRIDEERRALAEVLYKTSVLYYAQRRPMRLVPTLAAAAVLWPSYVVGQVRRKWLRAERGPA